MNFDFVKAWMNSLTESTGDFLTFYSDGCEHVSPATGLRVIRGQEPLGRALRPFANHDVASGLGSHKFEVLEYIGDQNSGVVMWKWTMTDCSRIFGVEAGHLRQASTTGMSCLVFQDGKIVKDVAYCDEIGVLMQLGLKISSRPTSFPSDKEADKAAADVIRH